MSFGQSSLLFVSIIVSSMINVILGGRNCCIFIWKGTGPLVDLDDFSNSDPYVQMYGVYSGSEDRKHYEYTTSTVWDDETPYWSESHCMSFVDYTYLYFQILDADTTTGPDFMGDTNYKDFEFDEIACDAGWITSQLSLNSDGDDEQGTLWIKSQCNCFQEIVQDDDP